MTALLFGHDESVASWVAQQAGGKPFVQPFTAFGFVDPAGRLTGGAVFTGYNGDNVELSLAGRAAATRSGLAAITAYVFSQLKCSRLQMHTRKSNRRVLRMLAHRLGVRYEGVAHRYFGREDGIVYSLTIDELPAFRAKWGI